MSTKGLLTPYTMGGLELKNRIVMAPMTRSRAMSNVPGDLMAEFYRQRASAGLIITEGTSPSPNGLGYSRIPGIFSKVQADGWRKVTAAVHGEGGKIFLQMMHTGRIGHPANMPIKTKVLAPSAIRSGGQIWTDAHGLLDFPVPAAMSVDEIRRTKEEFRVAAVNAMDAGFDGIELHGGNGYLIEEFLNPASNMRDDSYGGSVGNRCSFLIEMVKEVADAIGRERVGLLLSPYSTANSMASYRKIDTTYKFLTRQLDPLGILYLHVVDHSSVRVPAVPDEIKIAIRRRFRGTFILSGGYSQKRAGEDLERGVADLIGFGRPFINNPDLVQRFANGWPLSENLDVKTFYSRGEKGYTDYPEFRPMAVV